MVSPDMPRALESPLCAKSVLGRRYRAIQAPIARMVFDRKGVDIGERVYLDDLDVAKKGGTTTNPPATCFSFGRSASSR